MTKEITPARYIRECVFSVPTQWQFAEMLGCSQANVSRMETGEMEISLKLQKRVRTLAKELGLRWKDTYFFEVPQSSRRAA